MKLSVCIPVYNFEVRETVRKLHEEISEGNLDAEIVLIDDASVSFRNENEKIQNLCSEFVFLEKNIGRTKIRNLFLQYAKGDYLLFLDCDAIIISDYFLHNYIHFIKENPNCKVVYGGRVIPERHNGENQLRWKFAKIRECLPLDKRLKNNYLSFQTNNFLIERETLNHTKFNEKLNRYGYEDLVFSFELKKKNIKVDHTENPVLNGNLEDNSTFLKKVKNSVENIAVLLQQEELDLTEISEIKLIKSFRILQKYRMVKLFKSVFLSQKKSIERKLLKGDCSLHYLDFYKLGLLTEKM